MDLGDVLRHLLSHSPGPSDVNHQELLDAVNAAYPPPAPPEPEPDPAADAAQARIAELEAQLAAAKGQAPGS